jgi:aerobic-type carbon monoxide dehydrogenase small subunit (CoxS/CutS family)
MAAVRFRVNGKPRAVDADPSTPLLWLLGYHLGMTGTKFGCGMAQGDYCQSGVLMAAVDLPSWPSRWQRHIRRYR